MKLMDKLNDAGSFGKAKLITVSSFIIFIILVGYFSIDFFMASDYQSQVENPLSGGSYKSVNDLKEIGIRFVGIENILDKIFNTSNNININILPSEYEGRLDPFSI